MTGAPLHPQLPATAAVWADGLLDGEHLRVIQRFLTELPCDTAAALRESAEHFLAEKAGALRPDQLAKIADRLAITINPDGVFTDQDRARRRGFTWGPQRADGISKGILWANPELRANLDGWFTKHAAPGMGNPADPTPCVTGDPSAQAVKRDHRSVPQRQHDALNAGCEISHS